MAEIYYNEATKELRVSGSETFVKEIFSWLHRDIVSIAVTRTKPIAPPLAPKPINNQNRYSDPKKSNLMNVMNCIHDAPAGISAAHIASETGLSQRAVWSVTSRAKAEGKIVSIYHGFYRMSAIEAWCEEAK